MSQGVQQQPEAAALSKQGGSLQPSCASLWEPCFRLDPAASWAGALSVVWVCYPNYAASKCCCAVASTQLGLTLGASVCNGEDSKLQRLGALLVIQQGAAHSRVLIVGNQCGPT